jgi:aminopeptidase N
MPLLIILLVNQTFFSFENKQALYPEPVRAESTHSYDVLHYYINLDLPMDSRYLDGAVIISAKSTEDNLTMIDLHLSGLSVDSIKVDNMTATYNHNGETLYVNLPQVYNQGDSFDIMVGYSGTGSGSMGYLWYNSTHPISYTLGCPFCTRQWLPCYDRMWDKADYGVEFSITVPDPFYVCANGEFLSADTSGNDITYHWVHNYPIAPYLIHFAASIFTTYSDWFYASGSDSVEIKYHFWPQDTLYAPTAFQYTTDMIYFYDSLYGDYPFERYGMVILHPFYYAGMEHQTMSSIYRTGFVTNDYYLMAHEMSHSWWGDMITCFGWENVWLNEGFATYSDCLYREHHVSHQLFINTMISRRNDYFSAEASHPRPLYDTTLTDLFCWGHDYCKASWVLHMIRYLCADDNTWLTFMSTYRDSFEYGNASTDDANMILNQVLGGNYDWFFDEWVYDLYYPIYDITWVRVYEAPNWRLILDITQSQPMGPSVFHMPLPIAVEFSGDDTLITLDIDQVNEHFEFVVSEEPVDITVDPETWLIQKNTVIQGIEEYINKTVDIVKINTIGRQIELTLTQLGLIKVFDITGRMVYKTHAEVLKYQPSSAGIYHVMIGDKKKRVVVVK